MRPATCSVGLVSPRSTWLSIGALTPLRSARSRRLRPSASRSARIRGPTAAPSYDRTLSHTGVRGWPRSSADDAARFPSGRARPRRGRDPRRGVDERRARRHRGRRAASTSATCERFVGTSAGSIVAARLAAGERPRRPRGRGADPGWELDAEGAARAAGGDARRPVPFGAARGPARVGRSRPRRSSRRRWRWARRVGRAAARARALARVPDRGEELTRAARRDRRAAARGSTGGCASARVDGRAAGASSSGGRARRGPRWPTRSSRRARSPGSSARSRIGGREYVDGGAWSLTNLDAAPAGRDSEVLCLNPSAARRRAVSACGLRAPRRRGRRGGGARAARPRRARPPARARRGCRRLHGRELHGPAPARSGCSRRATARACALATG